MADKDTLTLDLMIIHTTAEAVLVDDGDSETWMPKVWVENWSPDWRPYKTYAMEISVEHATEKGFI
jgi:hypothetical protein